MDIEHWLNARLWQDYGVIQEKFYGDTLWPIALKEEIVHETNPTDEQSVFAIALESLGEADEEVGILTYCPNQANDA